jgi:hypothetical protein
MNILMLDTGRIEDLDEIEAVRRIRAGVAVETTVTMTDQRTTGGAPESAMLDRSRNTTTKPIPQPRPAPPREKRGKRR